jgi:phospholipid-transporting ATPase
MNTFILVDGALAIVPLFTSSAGVPTTWFTLFVVIVLNAIKDYLEDKKCEERDYQENHEEGVLVGPDQREEPILWKDMQVGMVVLVRENEAFPADLLLLECADGGSALVDTKSIDGETNLKTKHCCRLSQPFILDYEGPNSFLYQFRGHGKDQLREDIVTSDNFLLRGTFLRGQQWVKGMVLYTGHETKVLINSDDASFKTSAVEKKARQIIALVIILVLVLGITMSSISLSRLGALPYIPITNTGFTYFVVKFVTNILLLDNLVSITVPVGLQILRKFLALSVEWDNELGDSVVNNSTVIEDLGMLQYIISDKTGTLTKNKMRFKALSCGPVVFGGKSREPSEYVDFEDPRFVPA